MEAKTLQLLNSVKARGFALSIALEQYQDLPTENLISEIREEAAAVAQTALDEESPYPRRIEMYLLAMRKEARILRLHADCIGETRTVNGKRVLHNCERPRFWRNISQGLEAAILDVTSAGKKLPDVIADLEKLADSGAVCPKNKQLAAAVGTTISQVKAAFNSKKGSKKLQAWRREKGKQPTSVQADQAQDLLEAAATAPSDFYLSDEDRRIYEAKVEQTLGPEVRSALREAKERGDPGYDALIQTLAQPDPDDRIQEFRRKQIRKT